MKNFKKPLGLFIIAILGLTLANCKGKSESENVETPTTEISNNETSSDDTTSIEEPTVEATETETSGSEDYDKMLDDYDEYVTEYVSFYKKAMKGDQSALAEYPAMMEKAAKLQESMQQAQGNNQLSVKQITRMSKIQTKMLQAMQ